LLSSKRERASLNSRNAVKDQIWRETEASKNRICGRDVERGKKTKSTRFAEEGARRDREY